MRTKMLRPNFEEGLVFNKGFSSRVRCLFVLVLIVLLTMMACQKKAPNSQVAPFIRGYLAARVTTGGGHEVAVLAGASSREIYVPAIKVYLQDAGSKATVGSAVRTDLSGRFTLPTGAKAGRYQVCWDGQGYSNGCTGIISISSVPVDIGTVDIQVAKQQGMTTVFGEVTLADGSIPRALEPMMNINAHASVQLLDHANNVIQEVFVNNFGEYLFPQVPVPQDLIFRTLIDSLKNDQRVRKEAGLDHAAFHPINLQLRNHPPRLDPLSAQGTGGTVLRVAVAGDVLQMKAKATDPDGDPLKFSWAVDDGSGSLNQNTGAQVQWKLPNSEGLFTVTLIARDDKGGYARSQLMVRADHQGVLFSGTVFDIGGALISGAEVTVNGSAAVSTDTAGFFRAHVPDAKQFVLNIRKSGFALVSQIYDRGVIGGRWIMHHTTASSVDPTQPVSLVNQRSPRECPGPFSSRINWKDYPQAQRPQWQDGKGNVINPKEKLPIPLPSEGRQNPEKNCASGIGVKIPANSLVDEAQNPPVGNVDVALSTVDLRSPDQMPGDYTVEVTGQADRVMESYGAGTIEITAGGHHYNLKPGAQAEVTIPVDPAQLATGGPIPPTIPILFYDEQKGVWRPEGQATLQGSVYVVKVKHFSAINTDTIKVNQSCVDVKSPSLPATYTLEIQIPLGGGAAPKVLTNTINNASPSEHVIYNLPSNTNIVLVPIDSSQNPPVPFGTFVVNTGGQQNPTSPHLPSGPPYVACSTSVTLTPQTLPQAPLFGEFLHGLYSFAATNLDDVSTSATLKQQLDTATSNYYQHIDPRSLRTTLTGFKSRNVFDGTETRVIYANSGDLGFGRDMYCKKNGSDVACYVTNYGNINTSDVNDVNDAVAQNGPVATVAMEYSRVENPPGDPNEFTDPTQVVKFYVYNNTGTQLLNAANLDGVGARPVPQLCMVCHGGSYPGGPNLTVPAFSSAADVNLGSQFLPFDLHNYTFAAAPHDKASQQAAFKTLNTVMVMGTNPHQDIQDVINAWYSGGSATQIEDAVVAGWTSQPIKQTTYKTVIANGCRTCHVANAIPDLHFAQDTQAIATAFAPGRLGSIESRVCSQHVMPHAKRTHELFWTTVNPHFPGELQIFGDTFKTGTNGWQGNQCGVFTPGGVTPPSLFDPVKQVFQTSGGCTGCHIGASPPKGLNLSGDPYNNIVNVPAQELPSMFRITPNSTANSYLVHKINGTQGTVGGSGSQMPLGGPPLSAADKTTITNWVNAGAPH